MGEGAGAVDGELEFGGGIELHGVGRTVVGFGSGKAFFDLAAAAETPDGAADFVEKIAFERSEGARLISSCSDSWEYAESSPGRMKSRAAKRPKVMAFLEAAALPASVMGPVEDWAFRMFDSI